MSIAGLGTDIVEIARIEKQLSGSRRLAERILTQEELALFDASGFPGRYLAKRFAAKEAMVKALGTGIGRGIGFQQMNVANHASGQPFMTVSGKLAEICQQRGIHMIHLSIADERHYAVATVLLESH